MIDPRLRRDVAQAEGLRLEAYKDTEGYWTIGYGHLMDQSKSQEGEKISEEEAEVLLTQDLERAQAQAQTLPEFGGLGEVRQNAVVELVFNLGLSRWLGFAKTRLALMQGRWADAARELEDSLWWHQVGATRARRLYNYILTGEYPNEQSDSEGQSVVGQPRDQDPRSY